MPAPNWTADNVTEVAILGRWSNGRPVVNVFFIQREEDDAEASARDCLNNFQDHIMDVLPNNYTIEGARYRDRNTDPGVVGVIGPDPAKNMAGQSTNQSNSPNFSVLVKKLGPLLAGQRSGRSYFIGGDETSTDEDGVMSVPYVAAWQGFVDSFLSGLSGAGSNQLVLVHFAGELDTVGTVSEITEMVVQRQGATMRRRLRK